MCHESRVYFFQIYGTYFIFMIYDIIYLNSFHLLIVNAYTGQSFTQIYNSFQCSMQSPSVFLFPKNRGEHLDNWMLHEVAAGRLVGLLGAIGNCWQFQSVSL